VEQTLGQFGRFRPRHPAGFVVQITQAMDDAADLATRVIDLLQCGLDTLDGVLEQFDQHGGGVRLEQIGQRIRNLVDATGESRRLPPIDKAVAACRVVDCPPEGGGHVAAGGRALGVQPQRLIKLVIAPGDAQQQLDQGCRWLRRQVRLDLTPRIPPPGSCRCCLGFVRRGLLCQPCQADSDAMLAEMAGRGTRAAAVASQFAAVVPQFDLVGLVALDQCGDPVVSQPQSPDRADGKIRFATPKGAAAGETLEHGGGDQTVVHGKALLLARVDESFNLYRVLRPPAFACRRMPRTSRSVKSRIAGKMAMISCAWCRT